ncbi:MAG: glycosyltransferase [Flavobacteriaceae bacterium]|jgi:glycosyltransferase involved in cell wall biosynthesis|nr:glycosyltransferase [Flavobacteriaceae bacterium]
MSIRLLYIASSITGLGGVSQIMSEKVKTFIAQGIEVIIVSTNDESEVCFYPDLHQSKLIFYKEKVNRVKDIKAYYYFVKQEVVDVFQPQVILVIDNGIKGYFAPKYLRTKIPVYFECHGSRNSLKLQTKNWLKQQLILSCTAVLSFWFQGIIVLNTNSKKDWKGRKIIVIPNFIVQQNANTYSTEVLHKRVIAVSRISPEKNIETLLKVWNKVYTQYPTWQLAICGGGEAAYMKELQRQAQGVVWYGEVRDVEQYIVQADFLLHCSLMEGMPMVFLEAMNCAKPIVAFDVDFGPADLIQDNKSGFLVAKNNIEQCVQKVNYLIEHPEQIQQMGREAHKSLSRFDKDVVVQQWLTFFQSL